MEPDEMIEVAYAAHGAGYRTIVLQSGEDPHYTPEILGEIIRKIKEIGMAVTVSCGEMPKEDYAYLRRCGADRYLLKHETADEQSYRSFIRTARLKSEWNAFAISRLWALRREAGL